MRRKPKQSGVYVIRNKQTGAAYVGSCSDFVNRRNGHKSDLRLGKARSWRLQKAWNEYGEAAFDFVLVINTTEDLRVKEQIVLDMYAEFASVYNTSKMTTRLAPDYMEDFLATEKGKAHREKCRAALTALQKDPAFAARQFARKSRPVVCLETGQRWECLKHLAAFLGYKSATHISEHIAGKCENLRGLHFAYAESIKNKPD